MNKCLLCSKPVDKDDPTTWKQVKGLVGGPRKDSMRFREDTGEYAHDECVKKVAGGQAVDQPELFTNHTGGTDIAVVHADTKELEDLLDD